MTLDPTHAVRPTRTLSTIDLKPLIESAVRDEWPKFAEAHPRLAQVLGEPLVQAGVQESLDADPAYREAIERAVTLELGLQTVTQTIGSAVRRWFEKLV